MNENVISGLIRRRELSGDVLELMARVDALSHDTDAQDRTLQMFDPDMTLMQALACKAVPSLIGPCAGK